MVVKKKVFIKGQKLYTASILKYIQGGSCGGYNGLRTVVHLQILYMCDLALSLLIVILLLNSHFDF